VTAATVCLLASLPLILLGYLVMPWALASQSAAVVHEARIYLWLIVLQSVNLIPYVALQGLGQFALWNVLRVAPNIAALIAIAAAWFLNSPHAGTVARGLLITSSLIVPFTYAALWRRSVPLAAGTPRRIGELFRYGLPSALMIPAGLLNLQLDQLMLAAWLPSRLLGLYAVGVSWSALISPVFNALGSVIFPTLAAAQDAEGQRAIVGRAFRLAVLVVVVLGVGLAALTPLLLTLLFGSSFRAAVPSALVLIGASMVLNLNNLGGEVLRGLGVPRWTLYSQLLALPVTIVSLVLLLPRLSIVGAGISSVLAYLVVGIVSIVGVGKTCRMSATDLFPRKADLVDLLRLVRRFVVLRRRGA
jgi:O-antigen/teichoic acid export membrane protein